MLSLDCLSAGQNSYGRFVCACRSSPMRQRSEKPRTAWIAFSHFVRKTFTEPARAVVSRSVIILLLAALSCMAFVRSCFVKIFSYANLKEELRAAIFIASLVLILEHHGFL